MEDTMTGATAESPAAAAAVDAHGAETQQADSGDAGASDAVKDVAADGQKTPAATQDAQTDPDAVPLTAWADDVVTLPEGVEADADMLAGFGAAAVAAGLTRKQAQALVDWQANFQQEQARAQLDAGVAALKKAWGGRLKRISAKSWGWCLVSTGPWATRPFPAPWAKAARRDIPALSWACIR